MFTFNQIQMQKIKRIFVPLFFNLILLLGFITILWAFFILFRDLFKF